jgi:hypothetical protein
MIAIARAEFAMINPIAWVAILRYVTLDPPSTMYMSMKIKNTKRKDSINIYNIKYSFSLGFKTIK